MKRLYEPLYRLMATFRIPKSVVFGSATSILGRLLDEGRIHGGSAIDLGCGVGAEAIFLARHGFDVTGVDFSKTAIKLAQRHAAKAGVEVAFLVEDLTRIQNVKGTYDLLVDIGTLNDLRGQDRDRYIENVVPLAHAGSHFLLFGFDKHLSHDERVERFSPMFSIETLDDKTEPVFRRRMITSLLTRSHQD
jgi:cyclopropane fatty-acyl-phospholipid synthase-like methyltransferase